LTVTNAPKKPTAGTVPVTVVTSAPVRRYRVATLWRS
jgi:hypothetical protein